MSDMEDVFIKKLHELGHQLYKEGKNRDEIIASLKSNGANEQFAEIVADNIEKQLENKQKFKSLLLQGIVITLAGIIINYLSYQISSNNQSDSFLLLYGIVVFGLIQLFRAMQLYRNM